MLQSDLEDGSCELGFQMLREGRFKQTIVSSRPMLLLLLDISVFTFFGAAKSLARVGIHDET
jgi:hypothetical protein